MQRSRVHIVQGMLALLVVVLVGCSGGNSTQTGSADGAGVWGGSQAGTAGVSGSPDGSSGAAAVLKVALTSASTSSSGELESDPSGTSGTSGGTPSEGSAPGFDAVNVTVAKVRVHQSADASETDPGWTDITLEPAKKINLIPLSGGLLDSLGTTTLPAGHYTQVRLVLSANTGTTINNSVVPSGSTEEIPLATPSGVQSGIKLINAFDVVAGQEFDLVLDFDALRSIVVCGDGRYLLKPVIHVAPSATNTGVVPPATNNGITGFVDASLLGGKVSVSAQVNGTVVGSAAPNRHSGSFTLHLEPGSYDVVITADGHAAAVVAGVPVSNATGTALATAISTSAEPITLPTSTTHTVSGIVTLDPATSPVNAALVTKQTLTAGFTVAVTSATVDQSSGAYAVSLPVAAPLLGHYGPGILPVALTTADGAAGKFTVEASSTGYQTRSVDVDISGGDASQDFSLVP